MATLVYSDVNGVDRSFSLGADPIMVGRAPECAIRSDDPRVSRVHARFYVEQGALWVEDLGSANGIYVGPNKVQRAPVPTGEIVLVGSLMIRLLPMSGTLPPPVGLHGTLAQWLEMERKARAGVEDERDAFVKRVGEMFEEVRTLRESQGAHVTDAGGARAELEQLRKSSAADLESMRLDLMKAREAKMIAETQAGITTAERLAESNMIISGLQHQVQELHAAAGGDAQAKLLVEQVAVVTARADKAEKDLAAAQIRAQGAERNLAGANTMAAKAETRAADLEQKLAEAVAKRAQVESELAAARETGAPTGAGAEPQGAETASKLTADLAEMTAQFEARRDRIAQLERSASVSASAVAAAEARAAAAKLELAELDKRTHATNAAQAAKLAAAEARATDLDTRLRQVGGAEAEIAAARKAREDAREQISGADKRMADAITRADDNEKRASAADTMAKAMAKDVAEALRRAVDADARARGVARELDGAHRRAEAAEKRDGERVAATREAEARATAAEAKLVEIQAQLGGKLADAERDLVAKLEQVQRELAAERSSALALVDRKTQLERELSELRTAHADAHERVQLAEAKVNEYDVHIETLEDRIQDLESGMAVEQTASQSNLEETSAKVAKLEEQLGDAKAAAKTAVKTAASLEKRVEATETQLLAVKEARVAAEGELAKARQRIVELEHSTAQNAGTSEADRVRLDDVERRAQEAEARIEPLAAKAEAADLAIGRASALQRQLDEALQKLSWIERDQADHAHAANEVAAAEQVTAAEERAREAEQRARDAEVQVAAANTRAEDAEVHVATATARAEEAELQVATANARSAEVDARARDIEARAKDAAERIVDAERRARDAVAELADVSARLAAMESRLASGDKTGVEGQLAAAQARIAELKREVDAAENVRQFAANTEREIAQLERELRDTKAKATQVALERDRMSTELRDLRDDSDTTNRHARPESQGDLSRYTALVARATELEQKLAAVEKEDAKLRLELADAEARVAAQTRAKEDEPTNTGNALPIEFAEHLSTLEESIDSLRSNMRAASDETAMMEQSESVVAVSSAVSQAAEHVERARDALKTLVAMVAKA